MIVVDFEPFEQQLQTHAQPVIINLRGLQLCAHLDTLKERSPAFGTLGSFNYHFDEFIARFPQQKRSDVSDPHIPRFTVTKF